MPGVHLAQSDTSSGSGPSIYNSVWVTSYTFLAQVSPGSQERQQVFLVGVSSGLRQLEPLEIGSPFFVDVVSFVFGPFLYFFILGSTQRAIHRCPIFQCPLGD